MLMGFAVLSPMTYFVSLKLTAIVLGLVYLASHTPGAIAPEATAKFARPLARNRIVGVVLMLAATLWFVALTGLMDLGELSDMRQQLMAVWTIAGVLLTIFVPGLLPLRALGCLLLLAAAVMLDAAFLVQTPARFLVTLLAYGWVVIGMVLVYSPHLGKKALDWMLETPQRCRMFCWPGVALGVALIALAIFVYP